MWLPLERFQAWAPVRVKKMRQNMELEPRSDSIGMKMALAGRTVLTRRRLFAAAAALALSGCGGDPSPRTTDLRFVIDADDFINPNTNNVASPVVLRIYELKQISAFSQASFFDLLDSDSTVLGHDLVSKREFEIKPGQKINFSRSTPVETQYIGVIAGFRDIDSATWRVNAEIKAEHSAQVVVKLTAQTVTINVTEDKTLGLF